jgi:protein arginine kinase
MFEDIYEKPGFWAGQGPNGDIVLSTRVRLARNLAAVSFPRRQDEGDLRLINSVAERFAADASLHDGARLLRLDGMDPDEKRFLRERNIITGEMEAAPNCSVVLGEKQNFVIMINEEDHFRIQVINPGFQVMETFRLADRLDDELNRLAAYAYSDDYGYLTACPSNLGTGLRVSAMMHLPTLTFMRSIADVTRVVRDYGAEMRGSAGDGGKTVACMYQISNRVSLGKSEVDILEELDEVTAMVIDMENEARDDYLMQYSRQIEDRIWRSFGVLCHSRILSYPDAMEHLSNIRLGVILSIIKNIDLHRINDLMVTVQWSHLQKSARKLFGSAFDCDSYRADYLRERVRQAD